MHTYSAVVMQLYTIFYFVIASFTIIHIQMHSIRYKISSFFYIKWQNLCDAFKFTTYGGANYRHFENWSYNHSSVLIKIIEYMPCNLQIAKYQFFALKN